MGVRFIFHFIRNLYYDVLKPSGVGGSVGHAQKGTLNTGVLADHESAKSDAF